MKPILLNPKQVDPSIFQDTISHDILTQTMQWFEEKGKYRMKEDDQKRVFYDDFLEFQTQTKLFANFLLPPQYSENGTTRWDTYRNNQLSEILGFYGLSYWYTYQVSILGLGPIWISDNEKIKQKTARLLQEGGVFGFGLSEKEHGADIYSSDLRLEKQEDRTYLGNGKKYYIGNGNIAALLSIFGRLRGVPIPEGDKFGDYVFFPVSTQHECYKLVKNVVDSQMFVAEYELQDYPIQEEEILAKGREAWDMALNTVNIGKFNLGFASIGICTHAFYEAINHATHRILYGHPVSDFPHIQQYFVEAYARLCAMKLFGLRATDYFRAASTKDRRYLLYNPLVKMWVTLQGEEVINLLWDIIAAKGYEKDMYFENATRDIRMLPKLEGTVHVNMALVLKFMKNYFFNPSAELTEVPKQFQPAHDEFLFNQPATKGLSKIQFHDYRQVYDRFTSPNLEIFKKQIKNFKTLLAKGTLSPEQQQDFDFLLIMGSMFTQVVYGQLILEISPEFELSTEFLEQIFEYLIRDFSKYASKMYSKPNCTPEQGEILLQIISKPVDDPARFNHIWQDYVFNKKDTYQMNH